MAVTITEWNKETNSLVTQDYPPPPVQYIDITADNWMQYWGQEVEVGLGAMQANLYTKDRDFKVRRKR